MPAVILDQVHWAQLEQVQSQVEQKVRYASDMDRFGVPDWWEPATDKGDCEDIVLAKRQRLIALGWSADLLRIAVVIDGRGELHAVLTVDVVSDKGAPGTYVLDSHFQHVEPWQYLNQYGYTWLERSKPGSSQWTRLDNGTPAETVRIANLATAIMPASPRWSDTQTAMAAAAPVKITITASAPLAANDPVVAAEKPTPAVLEAGDDRALLIQSADNGAPAPVVLASDEEADAVGPASAASRQARHHGHARRGHGRSHGAARRHA